MYRYSKSMHIIANPAAAVALENVASPGRAERRAAPKPARIPPGDRARYAAAEGLR